VGSIPRSDSKPKLLKTVMNTHPLWTDASPARPMYPALEADIKTEVVVVGGGITGVSTAHLLARAGLHVVLLERDLIGCGDTAHTTAHLTYMTDTRLSKLVRTAGEEKALISWMAGFRAMERIRATAAALDEDVELEEVPGYLVAAESADMEAEISRLHKECGMAQEMGFEVHYLDEIPPTGRPGLIFGRQMKFHPLKYLRALTRECRKLGVAIHENTGVGEFVESPRHLIANGHRVTYQHVVIATHVPLQGNRGTLGAALFQTKLASYSTYAIAARAPSGSLPPMIWSDTAEPFHYLRVDQTDDGDVIVLGGEDHKTGQVEETGDCFARLEETLSSLVPEARISHRWSGQVVESVDGLPYIGPDKEDQFVATGFAGNGMTFGVVAAIMARDHITGQHNGWEETFSPSRVEIAAATTYIRENSDFPYRMISDRVGIEKGAVDELKIGEGCVRQIHGDPIAVCRDDQGVVHSLCAVCPHLGCIVAWNECELTWDCPCHGSRFAADGTLIAGPAEEDLKPVSLDPKE
jgi:glycine/D-amino acid oxidase-like deaminating enzyme/nitrite reductase/ring-hydroxylating ferredoxin subunit